MQSQKAETAYFSSKQLLPFGFAEQYYFWVTLRRDRLSIGLSMDHRATSSVRMLFQFRSEVTYRLRVINLPVAPGQISCPYCVVKPYNAELLQQGNMLYQDVIPV